MSSETVLVTSGGLSFLVTTQATAPFTAMARLQDLYRQVANGVPLADIEVTP